MMAKRSERASERERTEKWAQERSEKGDVKVIYEKNQVGGRKGKKKKGVEGWRRREKENKRLRVKE